MAEKKKEHEEEQKLKAIQIATSVGIELMEGTTKAWAVTINCINENYRAALSSTQFRFDDMWRNTTLYMAAAAVSFFLLLCKLQGF